MVRRGQARLAGSDHDDVDVDHRGRAVLLGAVDLRTGLGLGLGTRPPGSSSADDPLRLLGHRRDTGGLGHRRDTGGLGHRRDIGGLGRRGLR
ncbi:hypothetical protein CWIS_04730, partial [Cellulomonas sp. A375-1]